MKTKAAVLRALNSPLVVEEIDIDEPKVGEVRVKIEAVGFCHTDVHFMKGEVPGRLPMVLGHEGAGIVDAVGDGVTIVKPGDHVLMGMSSSCGRCVKCISGHPYWCEFASQPMLMGTQWDGTVRFHKGGEDIAHCFAQGCFSQYAITRDTGLAKIREDAPFDKICGLSCGLGTGLGAVLNNPRFTMPIGASLAVFGCGSVGLSVIMAAKLANAKNIVAIDMLDSKLDMATELGATLTINASEEPPVETTVGEIGQVDYAFECVGNPALVTQAFNITKGPGVVVIVGAAPMGVQFSLPQFNFITGKAVVGCSAGFMRPAVDFPRYIDLYMEGKLPLDKLVTHRFKLDDINDAVEALKSGEAIKSAIIPW